jgi:hypothetical protein
VIGLLEYLMSRPYKEVVGGIQGLQDLQEHTPESKEENN